MDLSENTVDESFIFDEANENILKAFRTNHIPSTQLLLSSAASISKKLNRNENDICQFVDKYESETLNRLLSQLQTPQELFDSQKNPIFFTVGDESIDETLNGGIPVGYLIEVSGKSASGKTNFLLTLSITIQLPREFGGLGPSIFENSNSPNDQISTVKTMYIPTESALPTQRLNQIVDNFSELIKANGVSEKFYPKLDNVFTTSNAMTNLEEQDHILKYQLPVMLSRDKNIKLLIIDSFTHHVRAELGWLQQIEYVQSMTDHLKKIGEKYNVTIIIANQVTDKPIKGLFHSENDILLKLNAEYQLSWMFGWDDIAIMYRQLMKREGIIDDAGNSFEKLDYLDEIKTGNQNLDSENEKEEKYENELNINNSSKTTKKHLKTILKSERKRLFDNTYKVKVSGIGTRPALGLPLLDVIDMRIVLNKEYVPIFDEELIDEFSEELGIDMNIPETQSSQILDHNSSILEQSNTSVLGTSTQNASDSSKSYSQKHIVSSLANNGYLENYNFQSFRLLKCAFGPLIPAGETRTAEFEIWKGGIRKYVKQ